jgi:hypothetical protein
VNKTTIEVSRYSSSGSRTCFICEEKITDITFIVKFKTEEKGEEVIRSTDQITLHRKCAIDLIDQLRNAGV